MTTIPELAKLPARLVPNPKARTGAYPAELAGVLDPSAHRAAREQIESWPGYTRTPLHELTGLAAELGVERVWLKDESTRFGLGAFKSIGGAYAVYRFLEREIKRRQPDAEVTPQSLIEGQFRDWTAELTVACASAGNHGRAVAWGAQLFGARCVVYLYRGVSTGRAAAIEKLGAIVNTAPPNYDDAVRLVAHDAARNQWQIISDTGYHGYMDIPRTVMEGYTVIAEEVLEQLGAQRPTHVFLQGGVGGFAGAIAAHLWQWLPDRKPRIVIVEPAGAACILESLAAGEPVTLTKVESIMGGLCCGEVSLVAWDVLSLAADWAVAIPDAAVPISMRALREGVPGDPPVIAGESGSAGVAALCCLSASAEQRAALELDARARVLLFSTEGATDPATYAQYTGTAVPASA
jgi:diaminopropionate ammonia-lyase